MSPPPSTPEALRRLGWTDELDAALAALEGTGWAAARVFSDGRGVLTLSNGAEEWPARVSGRLRHNCRTAAELPVVGDWVAYRVDEAHQPTTVHAVLPRRTRIARKVAGDRSDEQVLASNIDTVVIVMGLDGDMNPRRLDRYLTLVRAGGARPFVLLTKTDLRPEGAVTGDELLAVTVGVPVEATCLLDGALPATLTAELGAGRTLVMVGSSGAGKSTLINRILERDAQRTGAVRSSDRRGRHTTTNRQMFAVPGNALVIDTPGIREIQLLEPDEGVTAFPDVVALGVACRFRDCGHEREPGCAVVAAVAAGTLATDRLERFLRLASPAVGRPRRRGHGA
ncbi:MAG TPA: ribosome small subunit-dependent GTPase A [Polyangia bacterium]|jgi:ribosome biogenesis GTPase